MTVFGGPSLQYDRLPPSVDVRPPARRRDLQRFARENPSIAVFIDGTFLQEPGPTHYDLLFLLRAGIRVIGASSMGALRAAELRNRGMIGIGIVYSAIVQGLITDDSELALAMCPFTFRALSVPLVNVRAVLHTARARGLPEASARAAFDIASAIYFLERRPARLARAWRAALPDASSLLLSLLEDPANDVKAVDAVRAIDYAVALTDRASFDLDADVACVTPPLWTGVASQEPWGN